MRGPGPPKTSADGGRPRHPRGQARPLCRRRAGPEAAPGSYISDLGGQDSPHHHSDSKYSFTSSARGRRAREPAAPPLPRDGDSLFGDRQAPNSRGERKHRAGPGPLSWPPRNGGDPHPRGTGALRPRPSPSPALRRCPPRILIPPLPGEVGESYPAPRPMSEVLRGAPRSGHWRDPRAVALRGGWQRIELRQQSQHHEQKPNSPS